MAGIDRILERIEGIRGLPERNHEQVVAEFLELLGHPVNCIQFQVGRIDVLVTGGFDAPAMIVEVKKSLRSAAVSRQARERIGRYMKTKSGRLAVITDADNYEVYRPSDTPDDPDGLEFAGEFRLTQFTASSLRVLDLLRPGGNDDIAAT